METLWRWFFRCVIGIGVLFAAFSVLLVIGMNRPHVTQSDGYADVTPDAVAATLSESLPKTATEVRYCRASVGMGGRLLIYRFSAPDADLHAHAQAEFAAHWDKPKLKTIPGSTSPITDHEVKLYKSGFGIDADWMLPPSNAVGTLYESADGQFSHRPTIFVDDANGVLYFQMTD
ncbi:hypothetical protein NZK35_16700 [Stieleria sp. ICT_E10.1]|uniref:hypothetical protein n=1 Tax=Stieleria sedimenti TaxID=2976331 RepID=UPI0021807248|nr:hypothetical protein [Stieleria sedimenti]MCS7468293.1 hypothetical protein [Stieleria sedimenti]